MISKHTCYKITIIFSMLVLLFGGCDKKTPIKIGFVGGLTGGLAHLGTAGRNGVLLAIEERNKVNGIKGRKIEFISKDDKQNATQAIKADKELIEIGVDAIIGHMTSTMSIEVISIINQAKVLMISPTSSTDKLSGLDDYFIRMVEPHKSMTLRLAQFAVKQKKLKKFAIVYDTANIEFSESVRDDFKTEFKKYGGEIVAVKGFKANSDINYISMVESLLRAKPDGVLIIAGALDTAMICQHVRLKGSKIQIMTNGWAGSNELIQHGGPATDGVVFANFYDKNNKNIAYLDFKKRFNNRFSVDPNFAAVYAYEAVQVLFTALLENEDSTQLKKTILKQSEYEGLQGNFVFNKYGDPAREIFIITIKNGKVETSKLLSYEN